MLSAGRFHTCGVTTAGAAYCWGSNAFGQLGDGTTTQQRTPVAVSANWFLPRCRRERTTRAASPPGAPSIAGAPTDRVSWEMGRSSTSGPSRRQSRAVSGFDPWRQPRGFMDTPARRRSARILLGRETGPGNSATERRARDSSPVVSGFSNFVTITAGWRHSCASPGGGNVACWGNNDWGQLGDGTTTQRLTQVAAAGGFSFSTVGAGGGAHLRCSRGEDGRRGVLLGEERVGPGRRR